MSQQGEPGSTLGCLVRLFWMAIGNLILVLCLVGILQDGELRLGPADAVFWTTVLLLSGVRYADIRYLEGTTTDGQRATIQHFWRYVALLIALAAVGWLAAYGWILLAG